MALKECLVTTCRKNSNNYPEKLFLTVPKNKQRRENWFQAANVTKKHRGHSHRLYCCEDHFDLSSDAINWQYFKTCGSRLRLRAEVVPHKNLGQDNNTRPHESQLSNAARKRKSEFISKLECPSKVARGLLTDITNRPVPLSIPENSGGQAVIAVVPENEQTNTLLANTPDSGDHIPKLQHKKGSLRSKQLVTTAGAVKDTCRGSLVASTSGQVSRGIQVQITKKSRSVQTNTRTVKYVSRATSPCFSDSEHWDQQNLLRQDPLQPTLAGSLSDSVSTVVQSLFSNFSPSTEGSSSLSRTNSVTEPTDTRLKTTLVLMETKSRFYLGVPEEVYDFVTQVTLHTSVIYRNVFIVLKKIRLGDQYTRLADDFNLSVSTVQRVFTECVPKIANVVQELIFWPEAVQIKRTLPIAFRARYKSVESIIDCLEIEIEKPSNALRQTLSWSEYKKCNTVKFLISSTPAGLVTFISGAYGGRTTDKEILKQSGYLDVLPQGASVMADRGFKHVTPLLTLKQCHLIRPPSVSEGERLSRLQVKQNRTIASLRVHIERVIRRLREFEMLGPHACLHHSLLYLVNHLVIIACGLINIQGPLLKK